MKYVLIILAVVFIARIDVVLRFIEKTNEKIQFKSSPNIDPVDINSNYDLIPMKDDVALKTSLRKMVLKLMEDFKSNQDRTIKEKVIGIMKSNTGMFSDKLDKELESAVYGWRDLIIQRNVETYLFLIDLLNALKGENLEMVKKFSSLMIDNDLENFLKLYTKSSDVSCSLITYLPYQLPDNENYNELNERLSTLESFLANDKLEFAISNFGKSCQFALKNHIAKFKENPSLEASQAHSEATSVSDTLPSDSGPSQ